MQRALWIVLVGGLLAFLATPALAADGPSARDIEAAVERYLENAKYDADLIGGAGSSGYDSGFWIKGGQFSLRINATLQARYEYFSFDSGERSVRQTNDSLLEGFAWPGGDLSGFSLPRANLKFSGTAPCNMRYYMELAFGHHGARPYGLPYAGLYYLGTSANPGVFLTNWYQYDIFREGWIEWGMSDMLNLRMGLILYPNSRQLMTAPELQLFIEGCGP